MTDFNTYVDKINAMDTPILGMLAWYTVPTSAEIEHKQFIHLIDQHKAPIDRINIPSANNVFRRACSVATMKKQTGPTDDSSCNYTMRDAGNEPSFIFKCLVEETVDGKNHVLDHRTIADISLAKDTAKMHFECKISDDDFAWDAYSEVKHTLESFIKSKSLIMHDLVIREAARRAVEYNLLGVRVRQGGGVYFVALDKCKELESISNVINSIGAASFDMLPLVDDEKQREMLRVSFESESVGETQVLISEARELLKSDKITAKKFIEMQTRYASLKSKMAEYSGILNDSLDNSKEALNIASSQINALLDRMED